MATLVGMYPASMPPKCSVSNLRKSSPCALSTEENPRTDASPLYAAWSGPPFGAETLTVPSADNPPPVTSTFTFSVQYGCSRPIGSSFAFSLPTIESGSTVMEPASDRFPSRSYVVAKENVPFRFFSVVMFSALSRIPSKASSMRGVVVPSSYRTLYWSTAAFFSVTSQGFPPASFPAVFSAASGAVFAASPASAPSGTRRETFNLPSAPLRIAIRPFPVAISPTAISFRPGSNRASFTENAGISRKSSFSSLWRRRRSLTETASPSRRNRSPSEDCANAYPVWRSSEPRITSNSTRSR